MCIYTYIYHIHNCHLKRQPQSPMAQAFAASLWAFHAWDLLWRLEPRRSAGTETEEREELVNAMLG